MKKIKNYWSDCLLTKAEPAVLITKNDILEQYEKGYMLLSYGYNTSVSFPVIYQNKVVGVLNCLRKNNNFSELFFRDAQKITKMLLPYVLDTGRNLSKSKLTGLVTDCT